MADSSSPYCVATIERDPNSPHREIVALNTFEEVVSHLRATFSWFADQMADRRAEEDGPAEMPVGGFGVLLRNRWGSEVQVDIGRDIWFLFRQGPGPARCYSDSPSLEGHLTFWLAGWHHTELDRHMLLSRTACLAALRRWLDDGPFPSP